VKIPGGVFKDVDIFYNCSGRGGKHDEFVVYGTPGQKENVTFTLSSP
jgi:hypothetical protein